MYTVDYAKGAQARLYYFFMMADGDVSSAKRARFDQICEEMGIDDYSRDQIIWRCWKPYDKQKISHWEHIREKILQTVRSVRRISFMLLTKTDCVVTTLLPHS